ncbi:MAG TPA: diphthine--ammonia ligase, partial [archaeon]|nr:diphthine--ammonia ligase [archaeon]
ALSSGWEVARLVSVFSESTESYMYHVPNIQLSSLSSKALGIPQKIVRASGEKELELEPLKLALEEVAREDGIEGVLSGALASEYQKTRVERICHELGLKSFAPLWHKSQPQLLREQVRAGFESVFVGVYAQGFTQDWLGRRLDERAVSDLEALNKSHGVSVGGEGGEYETLVLDCPLFSRRIKINRAERTWDGVRGEFLVKDAELEGKA